MTVTNIVGTTKAKDSRVDSASRDLSLYLVDAPVPLWVPSDLLAALIAKVLAYRDLKVSRVAEEAELLTWPTEIGVCLIHDSFLEEESVGQAVRRVTRGPWCARVILLAESLSNTSVYLPISEVCVIPTDIPDLPVWVLRARVTSWKDRLSARLRSAPHLPFVLRSALSAILRQQATALHPDTGDRLRTVQDVAHRVGVTREHLSRLASDHDIEVQAFADSFLSINACLAKQIEDWSWDVVAWRMGYRSQAGLNQLMNRGQGMGLKRAGAEDPSQLILGWERKFLRHIL